jgi:hypothetical protein
MPLAERITFINNKEYILPAVFSVDTLDIGERKRNHFTINLSDTIVGNFSIAVTDVDYETAPMRSQNIYSWFLLSSDIKGYVHHPAWYFSNEKNTDAELELVMMTNGWTRFKWKDAINNTLPRPIYKNQEMISLSGVVNIQGTKKPFADKPLLCFIQPADTSLQRRRIPHFFNTDSLGKFHIDSMFFFDRMNIVFSDVNGKKSKFIKVKPDVDSLYRLFDLPLIKIPFKNNENEAVQTKMNDTHNDYLKAEGLMLEKVTVHSKVKSDVEKFNEKYGSSLFNSANGRFLDLSNETPSSMNVFDYLRVRFPELSIEKDDFGEYVIIYRRSASLANYRGATGGNTIDDDTSMTVAMKQYDKGNVSLFLDELPTPAIFIETIPVDQIAGVKFMRNFVGSASNGAALAIYMKKGEDLYKPLDSPTDMISYNGYAIIKEFYNPDYDVPESEHSKTDNRVTLLWNSFLNVSQVNPKIPVVFYNNDRTKKFKVVVEGITADGRFLMIEKNVGL